MSTSATSASPPMLSHSDFAQSMSERQYLFISQSLNDLERQVERHRTEQYLIFDRLIEAGLMEPRIEPHITKFRQQKTRQYRFHPYAGTMSTPLTSNDTPITEIRRHRQSLNCSPPTTDELGTKGNPIYVSDDDDLKCDGCNEQGHYILDCTKEYRFDEEKERYVPILDGENLTEYRDIVNTPLSTHAQKDKRGPRNFPQ
jgi:hypothetical protein